VKLHRALLTVAIAGPILALLAGLAASALPTDAKWPGPLEIVQRYPWHILIGTTIVSIYLGLFAASSSTVDPPSPTSMADDLALAVRQQWLAEVQRARINDPFPMSVRWVPVHDPDLVVPWSSLITLASTAAGRSGPGLKAWPPDSSYLAGSGSDLVDRLDDVPTGRLLVVGEPGAGKTVLLIRLLLDLLVRRSSGEPVPVLIPLASWDPLRSDLRSWMVDSLATNYPALGVRLRGNGATYAQALLDNNLVLPLFDGLDEIPDGARIAAIREIDSALDPRQRFVVAARAVQFEAAARGRTNLETRLTTAAVIMLKPLDVRTLTDYVFHSARPPTTGQWDDVLQAERRDPESPVLRALSKPLLLSLARTVYNPRPDEHRSNEEREPGELSNRTRFPDVVSIEHHLLDAFIYGAYRPSRDPLMRCRWSVAQAERWLTFLAHDLQYRQAGSPELAWWRLIGAAPRSLASCSVGIVAALAGVAGFHFPIGFGVGLISALVVALVIGEMLRLRGGNDRESLTNGLTGGLVGGLISAFLSLALLGDSIRSNPLGSALAGGIIFGLAAAPIGRFGAGVAGGLVGAFAARLVEEIAGAYAIGSLAHVVNGVGFGLVAGTATEIAIRRIDRRLPAGGVRWSWSRFLYGVACAGLLGFGTWIQVGVMGGSVVAAAGVVLAILVGATSDPTIADLRTAPTPIASLRRDRGTFLICALAIGLALGLTSGLALALTPNAVDGSPNGLRFAVLAGTANLVGAGLAFGFVQALWAPYATARYWLAARRRLPWRLMSFLADAHAKRGVLRQVGAVYQFRHSELQRRLAK
jgi:hypothetical protein